MTAGSGEVKAALTPVGDEHLVSLAEVADVLEAVALVMTSDNIEELAGRDAYRFRNAAL